MNEYQDWFERCISKTALLSRMKFKYDSGDNPKGLIIGCRTSNVDDDPQFNTKLAISQLVNDMERLLIENLNSVGGTIYNEGIENSPDYLVSIVETDLNVYSVPYGLAKDFFKSPGIIGITELFLVPEHLGMITFYPGENPEGKPGLWHRYYVKSEGDSAPLFRDMPDYYNCGQAGVAFKITELNGYQTIV
jgi:hypothetical protein